MLQNCGNNQKQSVRGNISKLVANYFKSSCQPMKDMIVFHNTHVFSGLSKTIILDLMLPDLLKQLSDCLNYKAILDNFKQLVEPLKYVQKISYMQKKIIILYNFLKVYYWGRVHLKILLVFTTKTRREGSDQLIHFLIFNQGQSNF